MRLSDLELPLKDWLKTSSGTLEMQENACSFETPEGYALSGIIGHSGHILIQAQFDGDASNGDLLKKILEWNFVRLREQRETIAYDDAQDTFVLFRELQDDDLRPGNFSGVMDAFIESLSFWLYAITQADGSSEGSAGPLAGRP